MQFVQKGVSKCNPLTGSAVGEVISLQMLGLALLLSCSTAVVAEDFSEIIGPVDDTAIEATEEEPAPGGRVDGRSHRCALRSIFRSLV
jgi:hypothetical protein